MPIPYELYDSPTRDTPSISSPNDILNGGAFPTVRVRLIHGSINHFTPADPCLDHPDPRPTSTNRRVRRRLSSSGRARFTVDDDSDEAEERSADTADTSTRTASGEASESSNRPSLFPRHHHHHHHPLLHSRPLNFDNYWRHRSHRAPFANIFRDRMIRSRFPRDFHNTLERESLQARTSFLENLTRVAGRSQLIEHIDQTTGRDGFPDYLFMDHDANTLTPLDREAIEGELRRLHHEREGHHDHSGEQSREPTTPPEDEPQAEVEEPDDEAPAPTPPEAPMTSTFTPPTPPPRQMPPLSRSSSQTSTASTVPTTPASLSVTGATRIENAIKLLQDDFSDRLDREDMMTMLDLFENEVKCLHFLNLREDYREQWLRRQIWMSRYGPPVPPSPGRSSMSGLGPSRNPYSTASSRISSRAGSVRRDSPRRQYPPPPRAESVGTVEEEESRPEVIEVGVEEVEHEVEIEEDAPDGLGLWNSLFARVEDSRQLGLGSV
ncbi:hypothetical protein BJ508DRAFT_46601 [Ascobolus immersus RN42]|uniref:Uncharacterized protein n=1 Tax=Ascobolus immersus RN42 TaxID=1160509 RepID=A0A3N4IIJ7_ASCIM|nr:hypothetical protein BJ508DRAFT_46601 [Ascobolus immersus RN42]